MGKTSSRVIEENASIGLDEKTADRCVELRIALVEVIDERTALDERIALVEGIDDRTLFDVIDDRALFDVIDERSVVRRKMIDEGTALVHVIDERTANAARIESGERRNTDLTTEVLHAQ